MEKENQKVYEIVKTSSGVRAQVSIRDRAWFRIGEVRALKHIARHSPDGFEFGYGGSGPADLALSILTDAIGPKAADLFYQDFKSEFIATQKGKIFAIEEREIRSWLKEQIKSRKAVESGRLIDDHPISYDPEKNPGERFSG